MRIAITGASGLIGTALTSHLRGNGHETVSFVRRPAASPAEITWDPANGKLSARDLEGVDAVIHLAGAGIGDKRWSESYKREILESRTRSTELLAQRMTETEKRPTIFLSGSAIGIYGARGDEELDENGSHGTGFLADVCERWERATGPEGGALKKQLPLFKFGLGGRFGNGRQWQSWISITDEVRAISHLLKSNLSGAVNLTAPNPVTNAEFTKVLAAVVKRPAILPIPGFGPKALLGSELADALLFTGQRVVPTALLADGYVFTHSTLDAALRDLLRK
jgi:NAD dependent epimerase/dehydratase family enzyme